MAAMFAGASRALLTSVVFAFETTRQPLGLLPLLAGCSAAYLVARMMMKHSIMTEKLARRGALVQDDYAVDFLARLTVDSAMTREVVTLASDAGANAVLVRLNAPESPGHQGFPVIDPSGNLVGVVTRRDLKVEHADDTLVGDLVKRAAAVIYSDQSLRDAADVMVRAGVGRLPVVSRDAPFTVVGIITRSDLLRAHAPRLAAAERRTGRFKLDEMLRRARPSR
jgi:CBS domain-containing protein